MTLRDPPRLLDSESVGTELAELLHAGAAETAPPEILHRSALRLSAALGVTISLQPTHSVHAASHSIGETVVDAIETPPFGGAALQATTRTASTSAGIGIKSTVIGVIVAVTAAVLLRSSTTPPGHVGESARMVSPGRSAVAAAASTAGPRAAEVQNIETRSAVPATARPRAGRHVVASMDTQASTAHAPVMLPSDGDDAASLRVAPQPTEAERPESRAQVEPEHVAPTTAADMRPRLAARADDAAVAPRIHNAQRAVLKTPQQAQELRSLEAAQRELTVDPRRALLHLREHGTRFPNGWLGEERAAFEVEALLRLGEHESARRALLGLTTRYPHSPALVRLRDELGPTQRP